MLAARACATHPVDGVVNELHCTCCNTQLLQTGTGLADREGTNQDSKEHLQRGKEGTSNTFSISGVWLGKVMKVSSTHSLIQHTVRVVPGRVIPAPMRKALNLQHRQVDKR